MIQKLDTLASSLESRGLTKLASMLDLVANTVEKSTKEIEVRMELKELPKEFLGDTNPEEIQQGFLVEMEGADVRIRKCTKPDGSLEYTLTAKYRPEHDEAEMLIPEKLFEALWGKTSKQQVKNRYKKDGWDIDHVLDKDEYYAEYELSPEQMGGRLMVPSDFKIIGTPTI